MSYAINRLAESIGELCEARPYEEKWLLAPSLRIGFQWLESVARAGRPVLNVRVKTLANMALDLAAPEMEKRGTFLLRGVREELLVAGVLAALREQGGYLARLEATPGLVRAAASTLRDLRRCGLAASDLSTRLFEVKSKGSELISMLSLYEKELAACGLTDLAGVLQLAAQRLVADASALPAGCLVAAPQDVLEDLRGLERSLWEAVPEEKRTVLPADLACRERPDGGVDSALLAWAPRPAAAPPPRGDGGVRMFRAVGEVNEVREVLRRCACEGIPFDEVEVLHTDAAAYVPLIYEACCLLAQEGGGPIPVTFSEGIPVGYSRPGRALAAWLSWIEEDFPQSTLVRIVQEGLLDPGAELPAGWSFSRLGTVLRALPIGKGRGRYLPAIDAELEALAWKISHPAREKEDEEETEEERLERSERLERRLRTLGALRGLVEGLLKSVPEDTSDGKALLRAAEDLLVTRAREVSELDEYSGKRLLDEIRELESCLQEGGDAGRIHPDVPGWLADLARSARVEGKGPRPGCIHVAPLAAGGHSGRPHTFILGLDDGRFPGAGLQDPLLLDSERAAISPDLTTAAERLAASIEDFARLAARLRGTVTLSYCCRNLADDRDMFPSPALLAAYRIVTGDREGVQDDLLAWLPEPVSFAPREAEQSLDSAEWWLCRMCGDPAVREPEEAVAREFPHLGRGMKARRARESDLFTAYDGYVPEAGEDLDPARPGGLVLSARRLEKLGKCPLEYFFSYVLDIKPPEEFSFDPSRWLEPGERGALLHAVFHDFMLRLPSDDRRPVLERDWELMQEVLDEKVRAWTRRKPPPGHEVQAREIEDLRLAARIFLREEEEHCRGRYPVFFELAIGMEGGEPGNPIDTLRPTAIELPKGKTIGVRGSIDRVDELGAAGSRRFSVCDYKTGSVYGYKREDPFRQGRLLQNFVYIMQAQSCLGECFPGARVESFQYFFPSTREYGERIEWGEAELADGIHVLERLCEMLSRGCFPFSDDKDDVKYSDYRPAFGDIPLTAEMAKRKLANLDNDALAPFRELRGMEKGGR